MEPSPSSSVSSLSSASSSPPSAMILLSSPPKYHDRLAEISALQHPTGEQKFYERLSQYAETLGISKTIQYFGPNYEPKEVAAVRSFVMGSGVWCKWYMGHVCQKEIHTPHGYGKMVYENGDIYEGQWKEGKRDGYGVMKYHKGDTYEGQWVEGKRHGEGFYTWANGVRLRVTSSHNKILFCIKSNLSG